MANKIAKILQNKKFNPIKLIVFGFQYVGNTYLYVKTFEDYKLQLTIAISETTSMSTKMVDLTSNKVYTKHLSDNEIDDYDQQIKKSYEMLLMEIIDKCFYSIYKSPQVQDLIDYVADTYVHNLIFSEHHHYNISFWNRSDNKNIYGLLMTIPKSRLGLESHEEVDAITLRVSIDSFRFLVNHKNIFPGFPIRGKNWITIVLDYSISSEQIISLIDDSYCLALNKSTILFD